MDVDPTPPLGHAPSVIVGIGASAGGLDACKRLLGAMPPNTGMAFVVLFHLDPSRPSHLAELLQSVTRMPVHQVDAPTSVEPDHVYVIAPNTELALHDGVLESEPRRGTRRPIDGFLKSLAAERMERAAAVVLSGTGDDGASGIQEIKRWGGLCLAQAPHSAEHSEMPRRAIATGVIDHDLTPEEMAPVLVQYASTQHTMDSSSDQVDAAEPSAFDTILHLMGSRYGLDLRAYKRGTLERRIWRRMGLLQMEDWTRYRDHLHEHPEEVDLLYHDVLIGVTSFFREPDAWKCLSEQVVPQLLRERDPEAPLRAWVAGCATGEEAYGLGIVLLSALERAGMDPKVQLYATNVNAAAVATAREGVYSASIEKDVPAELLARWFDKQGEQFHVRRELRESVTFATHNLLSDPPFSKLDLVSCRNVLIYFTPPVQDRVLELFHFALKPKGILFLGGSENVGRHGHLFETVSKRWRIYRSTSGARSGHYRLPQGGPQQSLAREPLPAAAPRRDETAHRVEQAVLARHTAACVAITEGGEILYFFGPTQDYLSRPTGEARLDLLSWARSGMYSKLRAAIQLAVKERRLVRLDDVFVERDGETRAVECTIEPVMQGLLLVAFRDRQGAAAEASAVAAEDQPFVQQLAEELRRTQQELQRVTSELGRTDQEHRLVHEELLSLNEELQSTNEELETSKEELQSLNEEMNTINRQLEEKNAQLRKINTDLQNLLVSTDVPTIFLDREFRITFFTPAATELMRLIPTDVGRSIRDIKERFRDERLLADARSVLDRLTPVSAEVPTEDGRWYVRRIVPYRSDEDRIEGVCITFSEVTALKTAVASAEEARLFSEAIVRTIGTPLLVLDPDLRVGSANDAFYRTFRASPKETIGEKVYDLGNRQWDIPRLRDLLEHVLPESKQVKNYDIEQVFDQIGRRAMRVNARVLDGPERPRLMLVSIEDITDWRNAEGAARRNAEQMQEEHNRKDQFLAMLGHELRNPLAALTHGLELLGLSPDTEAEEIRQMMIRQAERIRSMLDQLLDLSRVISGKIRMARETVDLAEVARTALEAVEPQTTARKQQLHADLPPAGSVWVTGDAVRLVQVVENLLLNASKYTDTTGKISLTVRADGARAEIRVRDTGIGIEPDLLPHVFDPFTQAPRSLDRAQGGLGLGLALVRNLVEMHGGKVRASSGGAGQGSEFVVTLPRSSGKDAVKPEATTGVSRPSAVAKRRVLLVDDEVDQAVALGKLIELEGHDTMVVHSAAAALEAARDFAPEVALLDIGMPDMDGFELARRLRAEQAGRPLLLVAVTGYGQDAARFDAAGFDAHLLKPLRLDALRELLEVPVGETSSASQEPG